MQLVDDGDFEVSIILLFPGALALGFKLIQKLSVCHVVDSSEEFWFRIFCRDHRFLTGFSSLKLSVVILINGLRLFLFKYLLLPLFLCFIIWLEFFSPDGAPCISAGVVFLNKSHIFID